jgi:hypothetical protein
MGLETIGLGLTIASGVMGMAQGFAQAGTVSKQAAVQETAARNNYYSQAAATTQLENEQAVAQTAATSTRMAAANRNLGTLQAVMGERGLAGATFTGMLNDLSNSESLDLGRMSIDYENKMASDQSHITAAGQDYVNQVQNAEFNKSAANSSAWLNAIGTGIKIGGSYTAGERSLDALKTFEQRRLAVYTKSGYSEPMYGSQ